MNTHACSRCGGTGIEPDDREIGASFRARRMGMDISLRAMADKLRLSPSYLSDLEVGRRRWGRDMMQRYEAVFAIEQVTA